VTAGLLRLGVAVVIAVGTVGCSSGDGGAAPEPAAPASASAGGEPPPASDGRGEGRTCGLVSYGELTSIIGRPIVRSGPSADAPDADSGCRWYDNSGGLSLIEVNLLDPTGYEAAKLGSSPLRVVAGLGEEAYLGSYDRVFVKGPNGSFVAGSLAPVADGAISSNIRDAAGSGLTTQDLVAWEASFRVATLIIDRLK
jgi:hypothetical protein